MKLSLRLLRNFIVVAEECHFGRAAERLNMTQPPLSQQMKRLEERLEVSLFARTTRSVQLTPAGEILLKQGRQLIADSDDLVLSVCRAAQGKVGTLVIGFVNTACYEMLPRSIAAYRERYADIDLVLKPMHSYMAAEELRTGRIDVAFIRPPQAVLDDQDFEFSIAAREPMFVALPRQHPLTIKRIISLDELESVSFIGYTSQDGRYFHEKISELFAKYRVRPNIVYESIMPTMFALVEAGIGLALVPASAARTQREGICYRPLRAKGKPVEALMHVARRAEVKTEMVRAFMDVVFAVSGQDGPL